jgi:hypothetical protein
MAMCELKRHESEINCGDDRQLSAVEQLMSSAIPSRSTARFA